MNRAGQMVALSCLLVVVSFLCFCTGCKPACTVLDLAHEACVLIVTVNEKGERVEIEVPGKVALEYLESGRIGAERCRKSQP